MSIFQCVCRRDNSIIFFNWWYFSKHTLKQRRMTHSNEKPTTNALYDDREILVRPVFLLLQIVLPLFFHPIIVSLDSRVRKCISKYFVVCMYVILVYPASIGAENQRQCFLAVVCTFWLTVSIFIWSKSALVETISKDLTIHNHVYGNRNGIGIEG